MTSTPLLAAEPVRSGPSRTFWQVVRKAFLRRWLHRVATAYVIILALIAVFVPFIANGRPYSAQVVNVKTSQWEQRYPLFEMLTGMDKAILLLAAASAFAGVIILVTKLMTDLDKRGRLRFRLIAPITIVWALWSIHLLTEWTIDPYFLLIGLSPPILYIFARLAGAAVLRRFSITELSRPSRICLMLANVMTAAAFVYCILATVSVDLRNDPNDLLHREDYAGISKEYDIKDAHFPPLAWGYNDQAYPLSRDATWRDPPWVPWMEYYGKSAASSVGLFNAAYLPPKPNYWTWEHFLGTDATGRDTLSRILWSTRIVFGIGVISQVVSILISIIYGSLMGYFGGTVDILGNRFMEIIESIPTFFLIITCVAIFGRQISIIMLILAFVGWTGTARFVRADFLRLRNADFVQAAISGGLPLRSILFRHILPNALTPVLVNATFGIAGAVGTESSLSFLGLGVEPPTASWGAMLEEAGTDHLWLALFPGLMIFLTVFAYNIIGEGLRDAIDPKTNKIQ